MQNLRATVTDQRSHTRPPIRGMIGEEAVQDIRWFCEHFELSAEAFPMIQSIDLCLRDEDVTLLVTTRVVARHEHLVGTSGSIRLMSNFRAAYMSGRARWVEFVKRSLEDVLRHELQESFYLAGERVYDPHKGEQ
jgi:hypothetical protein